MVGPAWSLHNPLHEVQQQQLIGGCGLYSLTPGEVAKSKAGSSVCIYVTLIVLGLVTLVMSGLLLTDTADNDMCSQTSLDCTVNGSLWREYLAFLIAAPLLILVGGYGLYAIKFQFCGAGDDPAQYDRGAVRVACITATVVGSCVFAYSVMWLLAFNVWIFAAPFFFVPCCLGVALGIVSWIK